MTRLRSYDVVRKSRFVDVFVGINPWAHSRLQLTHEWWDNTDYGIGLAWGNDGSDALWMIQFTLHVPLRLQRLLGIAP